MGTYNKEKYYYFMLKSNFFDNDVLKFLQNEPNGYEKIILYFKLIFKTINKDGYLIKKVGSKKIPYTIKELATETNHSEKLINDAIDYFLVSIDNEKLIINSQKAYEKELENNEKLNQKLLYFSSNKNINKKMNSDKALLSYKNDIAIANKYILKNEKIYIAGALVVKYGNKITILISGYNKIFKNYAPNYFLYYNILMYYKNEYEYACLNGISGDFSKDNKYYGLNKFKMGFNPDIYEYIGEFDLVLNKINYYFLNKKKLITKEFNKNK